jgi:hypothetical protein
LCEPATRSAICSRFWWMWAKFELAVNFGLFQLFQKISFRSTTCCFIRDTMSVSCASLRCASHRQFLRKVIMVGPNLGTIHLKQIRKMEKFHEASF